MFDPSLITGPGFWQMNLPTMIWELLIRVLAAGLCGALIGLERGIRQKEAGIRTHCIVALGAALLMIISKYAFGDMVEGIMGSKVADPTRVASQAITAIAFLGAGVIYRHGNVVKGLTTAAGVWATAAIGLAIGAGLYTIGVAAAVENLGLPTAFLNLFLYGSSVNACLASDLGTLLTCGAVSVAWAVIYNLCGTRILSKSDVY